MRIALFISCLTDCFYPRCGVAIVRLLEHLGHEPAFPETQTCCGQPMFNDGYHDEARRLARRMIEVFRPYERVVTPSASCAAMVREHYPRLFDDDPETRADAVALAERTHELAELLDRVERFDPAAHGVRWDGAATYHRSCHVRGLGSGGTAEGLLRRVEGLTLLEAEKRDQCCGFGGTFSVRYPQVSGALVDDKVDCMSATGAAWVVCDDAGCRMNISGAAHRARSPARFTTLAEILAEGLELLPREPAR